MHLQVKTTLLKLLFICFAFNLAAQDSHPFIDFFHQNVEKSISNRRFAYSSIKPVIDRLRADDQFKVEKLGESVEGLPVNMVCWGDGEEVLLLWSQMHGDEPTATMAMMDLFNFLQNEQDTIGEAIKAKLKSSLSIYFIPMLNPDGAEKHSRFNAMGIDINRDALKLNTPEGRILKEAKDRLQPDWGYNLHDQSRYYQAGHEPKPATFSFLAPAFNQEKDVNANRLASMQLICGLNEMLQANLPGQVGRYSDTFEPRAFGDNMQKWGVRTILVECGGNPNDYEKQAIRKWHFVLYLESFLHITERSYEQYTIADYEQIPYNRRRMMELVIRNVSYSYKGQQTNLDFGFQDRETNSKSKRDFYRRASISEIGDLTGYQGYVDYDASGLTMEEGKLYPELISNADQITDAFVQKLHREGYTDVRVRSLPAKLHRYDYPLMLHSTKKSRVNNEMRLYGNPSLVMRNESGNVRAVVVNGVLFPVD